MGPFIIYSDGEGGMNPNFFGARRRKCSGVEEEKLGRFWDFKIKMSEKAVYIFF